MLAYYLVVYLRYQGHHSRYYYLVSPFYSRSMCTFVYAYEWRKHTQRLSNATQRKRTTFLEDLKTVGRFECGDNDIPRGQSLFLILSISSSSFYSFLFLLLGSPLVYSVPKGRHVLCLSMWPWTLHYHHHHQHSKKEKENKIKRSFIWPKRWWRPSLKPNRVYVFSSSLFSQRLYRRYSHEGKMMKTSARDILAF